MRGRSLDLLIDFESLANFSLRRTADSFGFLRNAPGAADVPAVTRFLHGFWPQIPLPTWGSLFEYDWISEKLGLGFVLTDAHGAFAGFSATI